MQQENLYSVHIMGYYAGKTIIKEGKAWQASKPIVQVLFVAQVKKQFAKYYVYNRVIFPSSCFFVFLILWPRAWIVFALRKEWTQCLSGGKEKVMTQKLSLGVIHNVTWRKDPVSLPLFFRGCAEPLPPCMCPACARSWWASRDVVPPGGCRIKPGRQALIKSLQG